MIRKVFYILWLIVSIVMSIYITLVASSVTSTSSQELTLENLSTDCLNEVKSCKGKGFLSESIQIPDIQKNINMFNGFFPITIFAEANISIVYDLDTNLFIEVTKPIFSDKINYVTITCNKEEKPRFFSGQSPKSFKNIRLTDVSNVMEKQVDTIFGSCINTAVSFSYKPTKEIKVSPNEYVTIQSKEDKPSFTLTTIITEKLNLLTSVILFIIVLTLCFGSGLTVDAFLSKIFSKKIVSKIKNKLKVLFGISGESKTLKFTPELSAKILSGEKTSTWRLFDDKNLQKGDRLVFINKGTGEQFGWAVITSLHTKTLGTLTDADWEGHERFVSEGEMYATYRKYYGDKVNEQSEVKILKFEFKK